MTMYLISFPGEAMVVPPAQFQDVVDSSHAVIEEAKQAGVFVFGGALDESIPPVRIGADGTVTDGGYPGRPVPEGGYTILDLPSREAAREWAARIAAACRCEQELRPFHHDPASAR